MNNGNYTIVLQIVSWKKRIFYRNKKCHIMPWAGGHVLWTEFAVLPKRRTE